MNKYIQISDLSKKYNGRIKALSHVSLTINKGEKVFITGESGAGKSTLLSIIGLISQEYEGQYLLDGKDTKTISQKDLAKIRNKTFGFIFQEYALVEDDTVFNNVKIPLLYSDTKKIEYSQKINNILSYVELGDNANQKVNYLSGGQRQRVALARALINQPEIVLADEPTAALNFRLASQVMDILYDYTKKDKTLIMVCHDKTLLAKVNYRTLVINNGEMQKN